MGLGQTRPHRVEYGAYLRVDFDDKDMVREVGWASE